MAIFKKPQPEKIVKLISNRYKVTRVADYIGEWTVNSGNREYIEYHYRVSYDLLYLTVDLGCTCVSMAEAKRVIAIDDKKYLEDCAIELQNMVTSFYDTGNEYYDASNLISEVAAFLSTKRITLKEFFDYCDNKLNVEKNFKKNYIYTSLWSQAKIKIKNAREILKHTTYD